MTEINVSPKTPINQFKLQVRLNDVGWPQISGRSAGPAAWRSAHRQTDSSVPQSRLPIFKLFSAFMVLHIFFRLAHRRTQKTKSTPSKWQSNKICHDCEQTYVYSVSIKHNTIKTFKVDGSGLFMGHYQTYLIRTRGRNCRVIYDVKQTAQSSMMWNKLYNRLRWERNWTITYDVKETVNNLLCERNRTIVYDVTQTVQSSTMWNKLYDLLRCETNSVQTSMMWKKLYNRQSCERNCTIFTMWKKMYYSLRCEKNCTIFYDT